MTNPESVVPIEQYRSRGKRSAAGAALLDEIYAYLGRFVVYPSPHARVAHTLWCAHAHAMDAWESTPRIAFLSPEPWSGKTRAIEITMNLVPNAVEAINVTPAYLFRRVGAADKPTILFDEIDTVFGPKAKRDNEEIRGLLNAGHRKGAITGRCVVRGKTVLTEDTPAYCAVAMAGLGDLPDTLLSRAVVIRMRRRARHEKIEPYRPRLHAPQGQAIRNRLAAWAKGIDGTVIPPMPEAITDRNADVWEALLMVADAAGEGWPERARVAAVALVADFQGDAPSLGVRLLGDLRIVFRDADAMSTEDILVALKTLDDAPWADLKGKPIGSRGLAALLKKYQIKSKSVRIGERTPKGYDRADLQDAWSRYLPLSPQISATSATSATFGAADEAADDDDDADETA